MMMVLSCVTMAFTWPSTGTTADAQIAIIIDDLGHNQSRGKRAIDLPAALTFAVIPQTAYGKTLANYAHSSGKEVMVHLPMANTYGRPMEKLALTHNLTEMEIAEVFETAVSLVPYATGINNHMGSALTQQPQAMAWLMRVVKKHEFYFVDSRTTHRSVALEIAQLENLESARRDIFLDNDRSAPAIDKQFRKLLKLAKERTSALAIGHPYPSTLDYLSQAIPLLEAEGITIVSVSELLQFRTEARTLAKANRRRTDKKAPAQNSDNQYTVQSNAKSTLNAGED
ncbi:MAG: polysaccharide deacetylase 2 family uncharacterized protein YibQ [Candidatus Azotimanducaceae bacterium]|jgi:polysaccharide deacetylase 2 family uncharacterized protein YibQ